MFVEMGIEVIESDLAEFILQMDNWDEPSHIVFPNIPQRPLSNSKSL